MDTLHSKEHIDFQDPKEELKKQLNQSLSDWEDFIDWIMKYFWKIHFDEQSYGKQVATIYSVLREDTILLENFLGGRVVKNIIINNQETFDDLNDLQRVFFLFNDPYVANQLFISSWYLLPPLTFKNDYPIDYNYDKIQWIERYILDQKQKEILKRYYDCWDILEDSFEYIVLEKSTKNLWSVDLMWNILIDPTCYEEWGNMIWLSVWSDSYFSDICIWEEKYSVDYEKMGKTLFHEYIHKLDDRYYDWNESVNIVFNWYSIETYQASLDPDDAMSENLHLISNVTEIKAIFMETLYSLDAIGARLMLFILDIESIGEKVWESERCDNSGHMNWFYFVMKKILSILYENQEFHQESSIWVFYKFMNWGLTSEELISWRGLEEWMDKNMFFEKIWDIVNEIKKALTKESCYKEELDQYLYGQLDILYFWN